MNLLRRAITSAIGVFVTPLLEWINPTTWDNTGIQIDSITWFGNSSSDIGQTIEFDVKFTKSSYATREGLLSFGGGNNNEILRVNGAGTIVYFDANWAFAGLDLFDGEFHHFKMEKVSATETALSVDDLTPINQVIKSLSNRTINYLTSGAITTGYNSLEGIMKNFIATNAASIVTHDIKMNDGAGSATLVNTGTTSDATVHGVAGTDYVWTDFVSKIAENFATTLYTGNGTTQSIVSNLDYTAKDGLVWIKQRTGANTHGLYDTIRGASQILQSDTANAEQNLTGLGYQESFNVDGFTVGSAAPVNLNGSTYAAWQFMKEQGFFDIVEYVGDGNASQVIPHNVNHEVGIILLKSRDTITHWRVQHKDIPATNYLILNTTGASAASTSIWNDTAATPSNFTVGNNAEVNALNDNFITYLFAHNPDKGIFCGSYTGTGAAGNKQTTGFPVGWVLIKSTTLSENWYIFDVERGIVTAGNDSLLFANTTSTESSVSDYIDVDSDGFILNVASAGTNQNSATYIYVAIADPAQF